MRFEGTGCRGTQNCPSKTTEKLLGAMRVLGGREAQTVIAARTSATRNALCRKRDPKLRANGHANGGNNGQITGITDSTDTAKAGRTVNYTYDAWARLRTAQTTGTTQFPQWGLRWDYDRYGNRLAQAVTAGLKVGRSSHPQRRSPVSSKE